MKKNMYPLLKLFIFLPILLFFHCDNKITNHSKTDTKKGKIYKWKMATTWPTNFPVLGEAAEKYADLIEKMSDGQIKIKVYGSGVMIPALEVFGAVSQGSIEMGAGAPYYWVGKEPAAQFFAAIPFGMNAQQLHAWLISGEGYQLWKQTYAKHNLVPFLGGNTGVQMGGWFNKEINSIEDFKGLKMRLPGIAGKVLEKVKGTAVLVAGGEIYTNMERGVIDATEWIGPYHDYKMGFHKIAKYYYIPGWHEPGSQMEFFINKSLYDELPIHLQQIIETASYQINTWVLAEFDKKNGLFFEKIKQEGVEIREFSKEILEILRARTQEVIEEMTAKDTLAKKVYESYANFQKKASKWSELTEKIYYNKIQSQKHGEK